MRLTSLTKVNCFETLATGRPWPENWPKHHQMTSTRTITRTKTKATMTTAAGLFRTLYRVQYWHASELNSLNARRFLQIDNEVH
jgi:hypothetical protein